MRKVVSQIKLNGKTEQTQSSLPRMGMILRTFLRRFVARLRTYDEHHGDRITRQMIDCGEFLLIESERQGVAQ